MIIGGHFLYSHDLYVWSSSNTVILLGLKGLNPSSPTPGFAEFSLYLTYNLTLSLLRVPNNQNSRRIPNFICKILKYKKCHVKILLKRFHLNGNTIGFIHRPRCQNHLNVSITDSGSERVKKQIRNVNLKRKVSMPTLYSSMYFRPHILLTFNSFPDGQKQWKMTTFFVYLFSHQVFTIV